MRGEFGLLGGRHVPVDLRRFSQITSTVDHNQGGPSEGEMYVFVSRREQSVQQQRAEGRTGGGPACPWPDCGPVVEGKRIPARALRPLSDGRYQCGECGRGAAIRVDHTSATGLTVERCQLPDRRRPSVYTWREEKWKPFGGAR